MDQEQSNVSRHSAAQKCPWTIDSGASCHMTCSDTFFDALDESNSVQATGNHPKSGGHGSGFVKRVDGAGEPVDQPQLTSCMSQNLIAS